MARMIGLDLGASGWRSGGISEAGKFILLPHRFASERRLPYFSKSLVTVPEPGHSDMAIFCDNVKRFLGKSKAQAHTGSSSPAEELPGQLAGIFDDVAAHLETKCLGAVIPLPSCFHERERAEVAEAAKRAGFEVVQVPEESTMVVNGVQLARQDAGPILYFHLGAATLNLSIFVKDDSNGYYVERCYNGSALLGGDDFDAYVMVAVLHLAQSRMGRPGAWALRAFVNKDLYQKCEQMRCQLHAENPAIISSIAVGHFVTRSGVHMEPPDATVEMTLDDFKSIAAPLLKEIDGSFERLMKEATRRGIPPDQIKTALIAGGAAIHMPYIWQNLFNKYGIEASVQMVNPDQVVQEAARYASKLLPELKEVEKNLPAGQVLPRRSVTPLKPKEEAAEEPPEPAPARKRPSPRATPAALKEPESRGPWARHADAIAIAGQVYRERPDIAIQNLYGTAMELLHIAQELTERNRKYHEYVFQFQVIRSVADVLLRKDFLSFPDIWMSLALAQGYLVKNDVASAESILQRIDNSLKQERRKYGAGKKLQPGESDEVIKSLDNMEAMHHGLKGDWYHCKFERYCQRARKMYDDIERKRVCRDASEQLRKAAGEFLEAIDSSKSAGNESLAGDFTLRYKKLQADLEICSREIEVGPEVSGKSQDTSEVET
jgi:hypothetical protein